MRYLVDMVLVSSISHREPSAPLERVFSAVSDDLMEAANSVCAQFAKFAVELSATDGFRAQHPPSAHFTAEYDANDIVSTEDAISWVARYLHGYTVRELRREF